MRIPTDSVTLFARFLLLMGTLLLIGNMVSAQQWNGPDGSGNISSANSGNVGIGTTAPAQKLDVNGNIRIPSTAVIYLSKNQPYSYLASHALALLNESSGATAPKDVLLFEANRSNNALTSGTFAGIFGGKENTTDEDAAGVLTFATTVAGSYNVLNERMRITSTGNVGIGTTNPDTYAKLHIYNPPNAGVDIQSADTAGWSRLRLVTRTHTYGWFAGDSSQGDAPNKIGLYDYTNSAFRMMIDSAGNVGIGTTAPAGLLSVSKNQPSGTEIRIDNSDAAGFSGLYLNGGFAQANGGFVQYNNNTGSKNLFLATGGADPLYLGTNNSARMTVLPTSGNVGIGLTNPQFKLDVAGNINSSDTITGNNIVAKYQDVAEWVPSSEKLAAGTVVVLDQTKSNQVVASRTAYDTRVAGVISAQPGITLGEKSEDKILVATTGRVRVMVEATKSPINIGDLLVTSDIPGVAMKSIPIEFAGRKMHMPGTIIGKALEPLAKGKGELLVLLSLQ